MKKPVLATQMGLHSVRNMLGEQAQTSLFSEHDKTFSKEFGLQLSGSIDRFGIDLSETQARVVEGILRGFSETMYKGNLESCNTNQLVEEKYSGKLPTAYKYIHEIPRLRAAQSQILEWAGINQKSIAAWARAVAAIQELGTKQYCFYYDRLVFDADGRPVRDKNGKWEKEEIVCVDTLFTIKEVREEGSGTLKYYEITPSYIFLDQRESYFMMIPYNWREEVKALVGNKKASSYTFRFLLFLRYQYELKRRSSRQSSPYQIQWSAEEIATAIKMPDSIYLRKKKRMHAILEDAYTVAKRLGYLKEYERKEYIDVLTLSDDKYFNPKDFIKKAIDLMNETTAEAITPVAHHLFEFFHKQRRVLDPKHENPIEQSKKLQLEAFHLLLEKRTKEEIEKIVTWSIKHKFWCTQLSTPEKLHKHFSEAWSQYTLDPKSTKEDRISTNKEYAKNKYAKIDGMLLNKNVVLHLLNKYVEITHGMTPICISYDDREFEMKLSQLVERGILPF